MNWEKKSLIYVPVGEYEWSQTHASVPTVDPLNDDVWRIYYATRDKDNRSYVSYLEVEAANPSNILYSHDRPILPLGRLGTFDDSGIMPSWIVTIGDKKYLYYIGWAQRISVPYHNSIGLAISEDNGRTFRKYSEGPIFSPLPEEPYFTGTSCVLFEQGIWKNWYMSCTKWEIIKGRAEPFYHIKYAESHDGVNWQRKGVVAIDYKNELEAGIVRASVIREKLGYKMWFSYRKSTDYRIDRSASYRIGYAESSDGVTWRRLDDHAGIDVSDDGWDSEMIEYPHVIKRNDAKFLFYNGNGFGRSGFGYAISQ